MTYRKSYSRNGYRSSGYSSRRYSGRSSRSSYSPRSRSSYRSYGRSRGVSTRSRNGYSQYYDRGSGSWKYTHRRVAEKKLGGRIRRGYEVHHINHNKRDNRPSNLTVLSKSAHRAVHRNGGLKSLFKRWRK